MIATVVSITYFKALATLRICVLLAANISLLLFVYCQEALWREEAVKKKLAALQESTSNLMNSSKLIWTVRVSICVHRLLT